MLAGDVRKDGEKEIINENDEGASKNRMQRVLYAVALTENHNGNKIKKIIRINRSGECRIDNIDIKHHCILKNIKI
jgi:hypothetical protein